MIPNDLIGLVQRALDGFCNDGFEMRVKFEDRKSAG